MASYDDAGDMAITRWTPEERAAKQAQLASQSQALRSARAGLASAGTPSAGMQPPAFGPLTKAQQAVPAPAVSLGSVLATPVAAPNTLPASLEGFRPTGIGQNAHGGQIFSRAGKDGVTEFTNQATAQAQPRGLAAAGQNIGQQQQPAFKSLAEMGGARQQASAPLSLASVFGPGGQPDESAPSLASLGSLENIGNGLGVASFGTPGDAKAAIDTYERANQIRRDGANQDRLDLALARQGNANQMTVVRDSSRGPSLNDLFARRQEGQGDAQRQSRLEDVGLAQGIINTTQTQRAQQAASNRASRLEDLQIAATAPGATAEDQAAYRRAIDPTGQQEAERLKTQAETSRADAQAKKANAEAAKGRVLPASLQKLEDADIETVGLADTVNGELSRFDKMIEDGNLQLGPFANVTSSTLNGLGISDEKSQNYASFNAALEKIRNDTLRLNKGVQTEGDAQRALNELVTNIRDPKVVRQRLAEIQKINAQASALRTGIINNRRQAQGVDPIDMDTILANQRQIRQGGGNKQNARQAPAAGPVRIASPADVAKLPSGARFLGPDGIVREKP